jgi:hypothetical protein
MRERLRTLGIDPARAYFDIAEADVAAHARFRRQGDWSACEPCVCNGRA